MNQPYKNPTFSNIYEMLFCDQPGLFKKEQPELVYPFSVLFADPLDTVELEALAKDETMESRVRVLACNTLLSQGIKPAKKTLLGVIVEVGLPGGLDVLAAYADGRARYINYAEKLLIWENETRESAELITKLFDAAGPVVKQIGPWDQPRLSFPEEGMVRLSFLVSDGLYFGQGPFTALAKDPMGAPVIQAAVQLMTYLTTYSKE